MAILAIKGHETQGKEVIALLEILGGINTAPLKGDKTELAYYIEVDKSICCINTEFEYRTEFYKINIEEFEEKFPYKVGNEVIYEDKRRRITKMVWEEQTNTVAYKLDDKLYCNVINELQPYKEETMENKPDLLQQLKDYFDNTPREVIEKEWHEYDKFNEIEPTVKEYLEYVNKIYQIK